MQTKEDSDKVRKFYVLHMRSRKIDDFKNGKFSIEDKDRLWKPVNTDAVYDKNLSDCIRRLTEVLNIACEGVYN